MVTFFILSITHTGKRQRDKKTKRPFDFISAVSFILLYASPHNLFCGSDYGFLQASLLLPTSLRLG